MNIIFALIAVFLLHIPMVVSANSPTFRIINFEVDIVIHDCGAAQVEERVTYLFTSTANGVFMDIDYAGYGEFTDFSVSVGGMDFTQVNNARVGDGGVFTADIRRGNARLQVFSPAQNGEVKTFVYRYTLTDGAFRYAGTAVFQRMILGHGWDVPVEQFRATFKLPEGVPEVVAQYENIPAGWGVALGRYFWHGLIPYAPLRLVAGEYEIFSGLVAPPARSLAPLFVVIGVVVGVIIIIFGIISVLARPHTVTFKERYYRRLPAENGPALAAYLVNHKANKPCDIVATLLDLTQRGVLSSDGGENFTVNPRSTAATNSHEKFLLEWLFIETGNGMQCAMADINAAAEDEESAKHFYNEYVKWQGKVSEEAASLNYFETYWRRTPQGQEEFVKWAAFKRYIKNITRGKSHEAPPPPEQMERFLPYLISLGLSKTVVKITAPEESEVLAGYSLPLMLIFANNWNAALQRSYTNGYSHVAGSDDSGGSAGSVSSFGGGGGSGGGAF